MSLKRWPRAFTLIEMLVVVAIIVLLVSILLPALRGAREQGKIAVCLSNLRTIGIAQSSYVDVFDDLPWRLAEHISEGDYPYTGATAFSYGGALPDKTVADWEDVGYGLWAQAIVQSDVFGVPPRLRPMNPYIDGDVSWDREPSERLTKRAVIPASFRCPSDSSLTYYFLPLDESDRPAATWEFVGTSYPINWAWICYYSYAPPGNRPPYDQDLGRILIGGDGFPGLGRRMLRNSSGNRSSEFITFMESRMTYPTIYAYPRGPLPDFGYYWERVRVTGWHRKLSYHSALFLDGHAAYRYFDTGYIDDPGWTLWPERPWLGEWEAYTHY